MSASESVSPSERRVLRRFPSFTRGLLMAGASILLLMAAFWVWRTWDPEAFWEWKQEAGPIPFFMALTVLPAIGFPTTPFYILAGATFSPLVNAVGITISLGINVAFSYWIANSWLRRLIERLLSRSRYTLPVLDRKRALRFALLVKIAPGVPTFLKTYLIGMSGVSFPVHFIVCFSVTGCYAAAFVILGDSLADRDAGTLAWAAVVLVVLAVIFYFVRQRLKDETAPAPPPSEVPDNP